MPLIWNGATGQKAPVGPVRAGQPAQVQDGGPAAAAALISPHSAAFVPSGIIVDDRDDNRIRPLTGPV
jgi:hypothetical protein